MKFKQFICLFFCLFSLSSLAQTPYDDLPIADKISVKEGHSPYFTNARLGIGTNPTVLTTGPEQQCNSAIPVCQNIYTTSTSYSGNGSTQEIPSNTCLGSNELNSVWYTFTSSSAGNIAFNITPNVIGQDYDFALYNITGTNCSAISSGALTPIRCNFSATGGVTGLSASGTNPSEPASGPNQSTVLATTVGQTYVLIISNYSSSSNGYQLNFTPGTASIFDVTPPTLTSVSAPCGSNVLTLNTSEQITCASIAANGSDISISGTGGPYTISGATGVNCGSSTAQITFTISPALTGGGPWVLNAHAGSDGNSFIDNCGNAMPTTTVGFNVAPATPVITGPANVCKGTTFALSSSAAVSYTWTGAAVPAGQQNQQTITVTASTSATMNFNLVVSYGACGTATITKAVTVTDAPIANFTALPSLTVCAGTPVTFTNTSTYPCSTGGLGLNQCNCGSFLCNTTSNQGTFATYLWTFGDGGTAFYLGGSPASSFSPIHTYTAPGNYNVSLNASGLINSCSNTKNLTITVLPSTPNLTVSPTSTICPAQSSTLTATGGTTYTWSPSATLNTPNGGTVIATPATTTTYTVSSPGCLGNQTATVQVVVGGTPPAIGAISGSTLICPNSTGITYSVTNVASTNYTWTVPAGATITSAPTNSNVITVNFGASAGTVSVAAVGTCGSATASVNVSLSPALNLTVTPNTSTICAGSSSTLTASGATNYTWSPSGSLSSANGNIVTATPTVTTIYTIIGSTGTCTGSTTSTVTVGGALTLNITPNTSTVCPGTPVILTANGATNYTWSPSASLSSANGTTVSATPSVTTTYTVLGATGTCTGTSTAIVNIGGSLTLTVTPLTSTVCAGTPVVLTASGATNYTWSPSATLSSVNGASVTATPSTNTTYTVIGSSGACTGSATANISMSAGLTLTLTSNTPTVCVTNPSALLDVNGATSYTWFPSATLSSPNGANVTATPPVSTTYTVLGSTGTCTGVATINIGIGVCVSSACDLALIRSTLTAAGNIELLGMNNSCSLYFINPQFMTGPQAQAYAQTFGANLISVQSATENADLVQALSNQGYASNVIWIGYSDAVTEGSYVWYDGAPLSYSNWAPGEPNDAGGVEDCTQIYPDGSWNDLNCAGYNSLSVIEVNICPQVSVVNVPPTHCPLTNVTMNASTLLGSPNYTYTWVQSGTSSFTTSSTGSSLNDQITVTSTGANTFTVFTEDRYSCPQSTTVSLNVFPTPTVTANSATICAGQQTATLTANGVNTYTWAPATGLSATTGSIVTGTPASSQNYTISGTDINGCLANTTSNITVNTLPTVTVNSGTICLGQQTATLTASGASTYSWTPSADLSSSTGSLVTGNPIVTQTYSVTGTDVNGCFSGNTSTITVNSLPIISANSSTICAGQQTATLTAIGATTYSWIPGTGLSSTTGSVVTGTPLASENYTVVGMDVNGCISGTTTAITVNSLPIMTVNSSTICIGQQTATLTANGTDTYTWTPATGLSATTGSIVTGTPASSQNYTISGTDINGCIANTTSTITVNTLPVVTVNSSSICIGQQTATLTASGANTYSWTPSADLSSSTGSLVTGNPIVTQTYSVTGTDLNGCFSGNTSTITVNSLPTITTNSATICLGQQTATLTANGATTYSWIPGTGLSSTTGSVVTGTPAASENYTVVGMDANGCISGTTTAITVNSLPTITVNSSTICVGQQTATLTANGALTYTWIPGTGLSATTGSVVTGTPNATQSYTVGGIDANGCINATVTSISVNPLPTLSTSANTTVCPLSANTLTVGGASSYTWSPNIYLNTNTSSTVICTPSVTTTYTIDATSLAGCTNSTSLTIAVNNTVVVTASATTPTICPLGSTNINASGAASYTWTPSLTLSSANGATVTSSTSSTQTYTVIGATSTCTNSAQVVVTVTTNPVINIATTPSIICSGSNANLTASGASSYTWTPTTSLTSSTGASVTATPNTTTTYSITGTSALGCIGSSTASIVVIPTPTISVFGSPLTICAGKTTTLSAIGATNYTWSPSGSVNNVNSASTTANPVLTTTYTVNGTNGTFPNLCAASNTIQILVIQNPTVTASPKQIICEGQTTLIYANGATNYTWSPSSGVDDINDSTTYISPVGSGVFIYTVTGSNNNCTSTATVEVLVNPLPIVNAGVDTTINIDNTVTLIGFGNTSVGFINASDGTPFSCNYCPTVTVNPQNSTCYTLEGINEFGCRAADVVCVTVTKDWSVFIPNAFTPNGDIHNEVFIPMGYAIDEIKLTIYDRWGHVVFKSNDTVIGWDGTKNGKVCEQGVYVYQAEITAMSGEKVIRTGHVTLLGKTK